MYLRHITNLPCINRWVVGGGGGGGLWYYCVRWGVEINVWLHQQS